MKIKEELFLRKRNNKKEEIKKKNNLSLAVDNN